MGQGEELEAQRRIASKCFPPPANNKKSRRGREKAGEQPRCHLASPPPPKEKEEKKKRTRPGGPPTAADPRGEQLRRIRKKGRGGDKEAEEGPALPQPKELRISAASYERACKIFDSFAYTGKDGAHARSTAPSYPSPAATANAAKATTTNAGAGRSGRPKSCSAGQERKTKRKRKTKAKAKAKAKAKTTLSAQDRFKEAYRRVGKDHPWVPPKSPHGLLQESYYEDPWKVLIICLLCNRTRGREAGKILEQLFSVCPSAEKTARVSKDTIENIIRPLGLQKKRAESMLKISELYLQDWAYVSQIYGIGKYAADAYAIFCSGYWKDVEPSDHMLNLYWKFLHSWEAQKNIV